MNNLDQLVEKLASSVLDLYEEDEEDPQAFYESVKEVIKTTLEKL